MNDTALFLTSEFPPGPGGLGTHAFQLSSRLHQFGWKVVVATPQDYAHAEEVQAFNTSLPFRVFTLKSSRGALREGTHRFRVLLRQIAIEKPSLLVASGQRSLWLATLASWLTGTSLVAIGHGTEFGRASGWQSRLTRLALNKSDLVIAVSNYTRRLIEAFGAHPRHIYVIPNGADASSFGRLSSYEVSQFKAHMDWEGKKILITVGQMSERKGQEVVIRALPKILQSVPDAHYYMVGLPTEQLFLERIAQELGVEKQVHFVGRVETNELVNYLNGCDIFLMTSRMTNTGDCEGFGIAVVEAALCGKPAIVSGNSGLEEAVQHGETGFVVPQNDIEATATATVRLLADNQLRLAMGERAHLRAFTSQTWEQRVQQYHSLFERIVADVQLSE